MIQLLTRIQWLEEVQQLGANVQVFKMDISDRNSLRSVHETICATMPPIAGVANAAMVLHDKLFVDMEAHVMNNTLKPKVDGTKYLNEIFSEDTLDFFVLFSSLGSVVGNGGQSNYHAANLFMSSLATQRRRKGLAASVINIGMVVDVGYIARTGQALIDRLKKSCYAPLTETDIHHLFAHAIQASSPSSTQEPDVIMGLTPIIDSATGSRPPWYGNPRFSHFLLDEEVSDKLPQISSNSMNVRERLQACENEEDATAAILESFAAKLETMLQLPPNTVNVDIPILDIGADSLLAVEIRTWFLNEIHVDIPVLKVLSGDTVAELCGEAARKYLSSIAGQSAPPAIVEPVTQDIDRESSSVSGSDSPTSSSVGLDPSSTQEALTPITPFAPDDQDPILGSIDKLEKTIGAVRFDTTSVAATDLPKDYERVELMTYGQSRIWFLQEYLKDRTAHNLTCLFEVKGELQVPRLRRALSTVLARHESFRTCFFTKPGTSKFMQGICSSPPDEIFKHVHSDNQKDVQSEREDLETRIWDLENGRTFQATLITHEADKHTLIFGYHHIILDGVSWHIFLRELNAAYQMTHLKPATKQNADFAISQGEASSNGTFDQEIKYWKEEYAVLPEVMPLLPFARVKSRPSHQLSKSHSVVAEIGSDIVENVKRACRSLRVTPFHFHLAVMQVIFSRMLDVPDICIGVTDANRQDDSFSNTVGFFLNILALRFQVNQDEAFADLVKRTSAKALAATQNASVPFDVVLDQLKVPRASTHTPLFQVAFNYRAGDMVNMPLGDCDLKLTAAQEAKNPFDLVFNITQSSSSCYLQVTGNEYIYPVYGSELLANTYKTLLAALSVDTSIPVNDCPLHETEVAENLMDLGRGPAIDYQWPATLFERFEMMQKENENAIAVKDADRSITYSGLAREAEAIADALVSHDVTPRSTVAVLCEPSIESIASMLAVLKNDCVYMPLDLSIPPARQSAMVENGQPQIILCQSSTYQAAEMLASSSSCGNVLDITALPQKNATTKQQPSDQRIGQDLPAFLLYTSGSTGTPKGMLLHQAGFINYLASKGARLSLRKEVVLQQSSLGFDMSIAQIFNGLANGGTVIMAPQNARGDPVELSQLMLKEKVSFTIATPAEYLMWIRYGQDYLARYSAWRNACSGGEAITEQMKRAFCSLDQNTPTVTDCYGPTEVSAATSFATVSLTTTDTREPQDQPTIGKPIPNTTIYILGEDGKPVPSGFLGEIAVGGVGVACGYLQAEGTNRQNKFVTNPFARPDYVQKGWTTMYKTGDKGLLSENGSLVFLGRLDGDRQVKLRGLRIDLDDIARNLLQTGGDLVTDAAVSIRGNPAILVAHVVPAPGKSPTDAELMQMSAKLPLPQYMCPAVVCALDCLPMTTNGKVDWRAIDSLEIPERTMTEAQLDSFSLTEGEVKLIFDNVLRGVGYGAPTSIGPDSDFFALGGNSHLLVRLQGAIKEAMNVHVTLRDLYQNSSVRGIAATILTQKDQQPADKPIDWDQETDVPTDLLAALAVSESQPAGDVLPKTHNVEVLLTGSTSFLGSTVLDKLLSSPTVGRVHCVAVAPEDRDRVPQSDKVVAYSGSLYQATLGLSKTEYGMLQGCVDVIIHAGASGHCLNGFSSLRVPNVHSTRFLAGLAVAGSDAGRGPIPLHFISSNRVTLLSGKTAVPPLSMASHHPSTDGSEGFTAAKWASERFLEKLMAASQRPSQLQFVIHRPCAVVGETAPSEDALNALVRYSRLMGAVPKFGANVEGFFDFKDVHAVASDVVAEVLGEAADAHVVTLHTAPRYRHHSSGLRVPVHQACAHMESKDGAPFDELSMDDWLVRARQLGLDALIVSYLEAVSDKGKVLRFPFMGETEGEA